MTAVATLTRRSKHRYVSRDMLCCLHWNGWTHEWLHPTWRKLIREDRRESHSLFYIAPFSRNFSHAVAVVSFTMKPLSQHII
jgi:hypothetical protein